MSTDVTLKDKNTTATADCLFRYEMCFHKSRHIQRYTLHVRVGNIHQLMDILRVVGGQHTSTDGHIARSEKVEFAWGMFKTHVG